VDEQGDVVAPLPQWREADRKDVEAVVEVFAEPLLLDRFEQVAVGGGTALPGAVGMSRSLTAYSPESRPGVRIRIGLMTNSSRRTSSRPLE
jgi:hypothetical protein